MEIADYHNEFRDFFLLLSNGLLLGMFMTELPIESYEVQVYTEECERHSTPVILNYYWYGGINTELGDTRKKFHFSVDVAPLEEEFKLVIKVRYSDGSNFDVFPIENSYSKEFRFLPTDKNGDAIVNETLIWIKTVMVEVMSGVN